jgi:hypothetical protein
LKRNHLATLVVNETRKKLAQHNLFCQRYMMVYTSVFLSKINFFCSCFSKKFQGGEQTRDLFIFIYLSSLFCSAIAAPRQNEAYFRVARFFQTKNPDLGKFWRGLKWKMLEYFMAIGNI